MLLARETSGRLCFVCCSCDSIPDVNGCMDRDTLEMSVSFPDALSGLAAYSKDVSKSDVRKIKCWHLEYKTLDN